MRTLKMRAVPAMLGLLITTVGWAQDPRQQAAPKGKAATAPGSTAGQAPAGNTQKSVMLPKEARPDPKQEAPKLDPEAQARLDKVLLEWEQRSATIKSLDAAFYRFDQNSVVGDVEFFEGRVMLKSPNQAVLDSQKIDLDFKVAADNQAFKDAIKWKRTQAGQANAPADPIPKAKKAFHERIICTGTSILHYVNDVKKIYEYPLAEEEREAALQQGPLRFLFNMRRDEVLRRYNMRLVSEENEEFYTLQVVPKLDIDRNAFEQAMVKLNRKTFLPDILVLVDPNGNKQSYYLAQVKPNANVPEGNFVHNPETWKKLGYELVKNPPPGRNDLNPPAVPGAGGQAAPAKAASKGAPANAPAKKALR
ncbi:MAG: outer-membrane lipoprotein carrier protein LolA [Isosphaeraceae bacterium]